MSLSETLEQAELFIAGFEDDASQEGVRQLLQRLRQHKNTPQLLIQPIAKAQLLSWSLHDDWVWFRHADGGLTGYFYRTFGHDKPAAWLISDQVRDTLGRIWSRTARAVIDDFGNLVEVPA